MLRQVKKNLHRKLMHAMVLNRLTLKKQVRREEGRGWIHEVPQSSAESHQYFKSDVSVCVSTRTCFGKDYV